MQLWDLKRKPRLLFVEDDFDISNMLMKYFSGAGAEVSVAPRGSDVIDMCLSHQYDLITLDIMLPDLSGYEVFRLIRESRINLPVIFLTQYEEKMWKILGLELGAVDFITKPCDIEELRLRISNALKFRSMQIQLEAQGAATDLHIPPTLTLVGEAVRPIKVLFLAANPQDTDKLRLDQEIREIERTFWLSSYHDRIEIRQHWATRPSDLQALFLRHQPDIVHFSGHGTSEGAIVLENDAGQGKPVTAQTLGKLFSVLKDNVRCVVLNACFSGKQARAIAKHVDCVVGMSRAIGDMAAIKFSVAFYQAIAYGRDLKSAFELGCLQINMEGLKENHTPKLLASKSDPRNIILVSIPSRSGRKK